MKSLITGLVTTLIIGAIGLIVLRATGIIKLPTPAPSSAPVAILPNYDLSPSGTPVPTPTPSSTPYPEVKPSTKGGLVLGTQASPTSKPVVKTTTTTTHLVLSLINTDKCPLDIRSELTELSGPLTIKYEVKENFSAAVTIWKMNGEEVLSQKVITGSGTLKEIDGKDSLKFQIVSKECNSDSGHWLKITASR
ncbi:MAG: hypothetical protein ABII80_00305 [bacterium]